MKQQERQQLARALAEAHLTVTVYRDAHDNPMNALAAVAEVVEMVAMRFVRARDHDAFLREYLVARGLRT